MRKTAAALLLVLLAACSRSSNHTSTAEPTTTTAAVAGTTSTGAIATTTTTGTAATTTTTATTSNVQISHFSGPASPYECNAPSQVEIDFTTKGATQVRVTLDGGQPYTYANGAHKELLYLPCDGAAHTFTLSATAAGASVSKSITVQTKQT